MTAHESFGPIITSYTRAQALDDGALVDVTAMAQDARFLVPVALTRDAWAEAVAWDDDRPEPQDESGRLWDVLYRAGHAASRTAGSNRVTFSGDYRVTSYKPEGGEERVQHEVRADEVGVSLRSQRVTVSKIRQGD